MKEFAIVGGGIGGCSSAALLSAKGHDVTLIEKEPSLGGCASTFYHKKRLYNTGATTVSGYFEGGILKKLFDDAGNIPDLIESDPAIVIYQKGYVVRRTPDIEPFLDDLQNAFAHPSHEKFWNLIRQITRSFYTLPHSYYYSNRSFWDKLVSLTSFYPLIKEFKSYLFTPAMQVIETFYSPLDPEYKDFLEAQVMIVAQARLEEISFFTAAVALGYTFMPTHYPLGGMGKMCESLVSNVNDIRTDSSLQMVTKIAEGYLLEGSFGQLKAKNIVMATSVFDSGPWFKEHDIRRYFSSFSKLDNHQSAFVFYMSFSPQHLKFHHHYQLIGTDILPHTLSKALFVSISDPSDLLLSPEGYLTLTASIHVDSRDWMNLDPACYTERKEHLQTLIEKKVCDTLGIQRDNIIDSFAATPKTFKRYINRDQLGGNPLKLGMNIFSIPANDSPIHGLYHAGDTVFPAQGWPGVAMGAYNLIRTLRE